MRNYLLSDTLRVLKEHFDLLIVSHYALVPEFKEHFEQQGISVCKWLDDRPSEEAADVHRMTETAYFYKARSKSRERRLFSRINSAGKGGLDSWLGQKLAPTLFPLLRSFYQYLVLRDWIHLIKIRDLFERKMVDAVFSTNQMNNSEWGPVMAARSLGLPVVTAITSWDNPSTKTFPILSDYDGYLAWGERMRDATIRHQGIRDSRRIHIVGAPQFDFLRDENYALSREEFCESMGLDPTRKILVYTTVTPGIMPDEPHMVRRVHDMILDGTLPSKTQLLVRLHPKDRMERYEELRKDPRRSPIVWTLAGNPKIQKRDQWCPDRDDMVRAVNTVRHGDVNVHCRYSTMMLDFACMDKPVVVLAYDNAGDTAGAKVYEDYEHLKPVLASGGVRVAYAESEARTMLQEAFASPEKHRSERKKMVEEQLGFLDGRSGERAGRVIVDIVRREATPNRIWRRRLLHACKMQCVGALYFLARLPYRVRRRVFATSVK
ncbi:MAG: CDP-glycerol glycerophosphotransferase family protein [Planctomycetota bacterium]